MFRLIDILRKIISRWWWYWCIKNSFGGSKRRRTIQNRLYTVLSSRVSSV